MAKKSKRRGAGEGSIFQRKDGRWQGEIFLGIINGKRTRKTVYGLTQGEVRQKLDALKEEKRAGKAVASCRQSVGEFLQVWIAGQAAVINRPSTLLKYRNSVRLYLVPHIGDVKLQKLTREQVEAMYGAMRDRGLSPHTVQLTHVVLRMALEDAVDRGLIATNPARKAKRARIEKTDVKPFSWEQIAKILEAADPEDLRAFWHLAVYTGCRCGEILGLQWGDVNLQGGKLTIRRSVSEVSGHMTVGPPKTERSRRTISIHVDAVDALQKHRAELLKRGLAGSEWVFPNTTGAAVTHRRVLWDSWKRVLKRSNLSDLRLHDLRHAHASLMLAAGVPVKTVSERLGHHDAGFTLNVYGHLMENADAAAADTFGEVLRNAVPVKRPVDDSAEAV